VEKSSTVRWAGYVKCMGEKRSAYRVFVAKLESTRPLGSTGCRWGKNIKTDLQGIVVDLWNGLIWLRIGTCGRLL
jgi:hypothetical protein